MENQELQKISENRLITKSQSEFAEKLNLILQDSKKISEYENPMVREIMFANAKAQVMSILTDDVMVNIYSLFGDPDGVKCDKVYSNDVKKRIFAQACMQGLSCRGNQINVIAGNLYITAKGYLPKLRNFPKLNSFVYPFRHRIPVKDNATLTTTVTTDMEWVFDGKLHKETVIYPVARQEGQGNDAILGKANTKMSCWLWNKVSGEDTTDDSGIYTDAIVVESKVNEQQKTGANVTESNKMISEEFQTKFNNYISKEENGVLIAKSVADLEKRAKTWLDSSVAKDNGANYLIVDGKLSSETVNLSLFNELILKLG